MPVQATCPHCSAKLRLSDAIPPGKGIRCPKCRQGFRFQPAVAPAPVPSPNRPPQQRPVRQPEADDDEPAPRTPRNRPKGKRRKKKKQNNLVLWVSIGVGAVVLLGGGVVTAIMLSQSPSGAPKTAENKQPDTAFEIPNPNPNVIPGGNDPNTNPTGNAPNTNSPNVSKDGWVTFQSKLLPCQAEFPRQPKEDVNTKGGVSIPIVEANVLADGGTKFLAQYSLTGGPVHPNDRNLSAKQLRDNFYDIFKDDPQEFQCKLFEIQGYPAIEVANDGMDFGVKLRLTTRTVYKKGESYSISVAQRKGAEDPQTAERFLNSFKLLGPSGGPTNTGSPNTNKPPTTKPDTEVVKTKAHEYFSDSAFGYKNVKIVNLTGPMVPSQKTVQLYGNGVQAYYVTFTGTNVVGKQFTESNVLIYVTGSGNQSRVSGYLTNHDRIMETEGKDWYAKNPPPKS